MKFGSCIRVSRVIQQERHFVIFAPSAYQEGFNCCYNVAKATNFVEFSWVDIDKLVSASMEKVWLFNNNA